MKKCLTMLCSIVAVLMGCSENPDGTRLSSLEDEAQVAFIALPQNDAEAENAAPVLSMPESLELKLGGAAKIEVQIADPDDDIDALSYEWRADDPLILTQKTRESATVTLPPTVLPNTQYRVIYRAVDPAENTVSAETLLVAVGVVIALESPVNAQSLASQDVSFSGSADVAGGIDIMNGDVVLCSARIENGAWACQSHLDFGNYTVKAVWSSNLSQTSASVAFSVVDENETQNHPPVLVGEAAFFGAPSENIVVDYTQSYDVDGDELEFSWSSSSAQIAFDIDEMSGAGKVNVVMPSNAERGACYEIQLAVSDGTDRVEKSIPLCVTDLPYLEIVYPTDGAKVDCGENGEVFIVGKADPGLEIEVGGCTTVADHNGNWQCLVYGAGTYVAQNAASGAQSKSVTFSTQNGEKIDFDKPEFVRMDGGSCRISAPHDHTGLAWFACIGALGALIVVHRRSL